MLGSTKKAERVQTPKQDKDEEEKNTTEGGHEKNTKSCNEMTFELGQFSKQEEKNTDITEYLLGRGNVNHIDSGKNFVRYNY